MSNSEENQGEESSKMPETDDGEKISVTVKTLDGQNRTFQVSPQMTIEKFKELIADKIKIAKESQRMIYQGRVMVDEKPLSEYDVHEKVIHVVQRPPPSLHQPAPGTESSTSTPTPQPTTGATMDGIDLQIHVSRMNNGPSGSEARGRIRQVELNLGIINDTLNLIERRSNSTGTSTTEDNPDPGTEDRPAGQSSEDRSRESTIMATELADVLDRVLSTNDRMAPHIERYRNLLRSDESASTSSQDTARDNRQVIERVREALHAMSHAMHSLSDVMVDITAAPPRQCVALPPQPFMDPGANAIGIPIHMNLRSRSRGRRTQQTTSGTNTTSTATSSTPSATAASNTTTSQASRAFTPSTETTQGFHVDPIQIPGGGTIRMDPQVTVEVFPTSVAVHEVHATGVPLIPTNEAPGGPTANQTSASTQATATSTSSNAASSQPTSNSAGMSFGPTTTVNVGGQMPDLSSLFNVPGMPGGMIQNMVQSILNNHGVRPGQSVQVNVTSGMRLPFNIQQPPTQPQRTDTSATPTATSVTGVIMDVPIDDDVPMRRIPPTPPPPPPRTQGQTTNSTSRESTSTPGNITRHFRANTSSGTQTRIPPPPSLFLQQQHHHHHHHHHNPARPQRPAEAVRGNTSSSTQTIPPPPPLFQHMQQPRANGSRARPRGRGMMPGSMRMPSGNRRRVYDLYLPCSSAYYSSASASRAARNMGVQRLGTSQFTVPNLSTMVSGMVGDIFSGQTPAAGSGSGTRRTENRGSGSTSNTAGPDGSSSTERPAPSSPINPIELLASLMSGSSAAGTEAGNSGPAPAGIGRVLMNLMAPGGTLADLMNFFRPSEDSSPEGPQLALGILDIVTTNLGPTNLFQIVMGQIESLARLRQPLRDFVSAQISQHGSLDSVITRGLDEVQGEILHLQSRLEGRPGVDFAASIRSCLRCHMLAFVETVQSPDYSREQFGEELYAQWISTLADLISLCVYYIGQDNFPSRLLEQLPSMMQGMNPALTGWMTSTVETFITNFRRNHPVSEADIVRFVVSSSPSQGERPSQVTTTQAAQGVVQDVLTTPTRLDQISPLSSSDNESPSAQPPKAKVARTQESDSEQFVDARESASAGHNLSRTSRDVSARDASGDTAMDTSDTWQTVIPQEWIPVINRDISRQQNQRQQPAFSDAYIQGLPAKRRRMMSLEQSEMANMIEYLPASLARAARTVNAQPISSEENLRSEASYNHELLQDLEQEVCSQLESRIDADTDFNSDRFPNSKEFFRRDKKQ